MFMILILGTNIVTCCHQFFCCKRFFLELKIGNISFKNACIADST